MNNKPPETLYHYCSNETFVSIVQSQTIRLSSLHLSNDTQEGLWIDQIVSKFLKKDKASQNYRKNISKLYYPVDALGFCLSEQGDMLSQWRGYANDGMGVSIGFDTKYLKKKDADGTKSGYSLQKISYHEAEQIKLITPLIYTVKELWPRNPSIPIEQINEQIGNDAYKFWDLKFKIKNPAFSEEKEWRLISPYVTNAKEGPDFVELRAQHNRLVPYREYQIEKDCICKIILGPKNTSNEIDLKNYLALQGLSNVEVIRSKATYR